MILQPVDKLLDSIYACDSGASYQVATPKEGILSTQRFTIVSRLDASGPTELARMEWREFHSALIRLPSTSQSPQTSIKVEEFLRKKGSSHSLRFFTAPDGREYQWNASNNHMTLTTVGGEMTTPIATFFPASAGVFSSTRAPAHLDIHSQSEPMSDTILTTFIVMLKLLIDYKEVRKAGVTVADAGIDMGLGNWQ